MIDAGEVKLEGDYGPGSGVGAGLVLHPHPLYGGSMRNNVVDAVADGFLAAGLSVLRINFRGVGRSTGAYGDGVGERDDVAAAAGWLQEQGAGTIHVAGYSFGAHVAAFSWPKLTPLGVEPLMLIAPPAALMPFDGLDPSTAVGLIICGGRDDIGPPNLAESLGQGLERPVSPVVLDGADHFFGGFEDRLAALIRDHVSARG
jgi:hypothetical protein